MAVGETLQAGDNEDLALALRHARPRVFGALAGDAATREEGDVAREDAPLASLEAGEEEEEEAEEAEEDVDVDVAVEKLAHEA